MCKLKTKKKKLSEKQSKVIKYWHHQKILFVFVCMYEMVDIGKKTYENNDIEVIADGIALLWLNEKNMEEKLGLQNLPVIKIKCDPAYKKHRYE